MDNSDIEKKDQYDKYRASRIKYYLKKEGINISNDEALSFIVDADRTQGKYDERIRRAMSGFKPTPEMIEKIIAMNDGLYERLKAAYNSMRERKNRIDREIAEGKHSISGYTIYVQFYIGYERDEHGIPTADEYMELYELSDETVDYALPKMIFDEKTPIPEFSEWEKENLPLGSLDIPELEGHRIYAFMKDVFCDTRTFCLADIEYLTAKDLTWDITVDYEHFDWDKSNINFSIEDLK